MIEIKVKTKQQRKEIMEKIFGLTTVEAMVLMDIIEHKIETEKGWSFNRKKIPDARGKKGAQFNNTLSRLRAKGVLGVDNTRLGKNIIPEVVLSNEPIKITFKEEGLI